MEFSKAELLKKEHVEIPGSWANYSKQHINLVFNGLHQRTYQYVHRCIRENTMEYFFKNLNCYCFLDKQQKEVSKLKSIYHFNFFIIYVKYNRTYRAETQFIYLQQFYIHSFTWFIHSNPQVQAEPWCPPEARF